MKLVSFLVASLLSLASLSANPEHHINNAYKSLKNRNFEQAKIHLNQALRENPNHAKALELKGRIAFTEGRKQESISYLTQSLESKPDATVYFDRGVAHLAEGNVQQASKDMRKGMEMKPSLFRRLQDAAPKKEIAFKATSSKKVFKSKAKKANKGPRGMTKHHKKLGLQPISMKKGIVKIKKGIVAFKPKTSKKKK